MKKQFKFVEKRNFWIFISLIFFVLGFGKMINNTFNTEPSLNYGIDFVGGNTFLINYSNNTISNNEISIKIRNILKQYNLEKSQIQFTNTDEIFIKTSTIETNITNDILNDLKISLGNFEILEIDFIGPSIGKKLKEQSIWIVMFVSLALLAYISMRFMWVYGVAAIIALIHDGLMIISIASLFNLEINTAFIAALLSILGYSINDTIVIFDRIREHYEKLKNYKPFSDIANSALNQTIVRTINTSLTTLVVILSLILFGGSTIKEFCIILFIGILSGTYSSLCIASPILASIHPETEEN